ncbi:MAG: vanadium-dependent haloperoxidase [Pyrinomonadaceae bacterium]|nr:vanadium-dependent haloperoxidase [Pyrinomonadaceae bacterium]
MSEENGTGEPLDEESRRWFLKSVAGASAAFGAIPGLIAGTASEVSAQKEAPSKALGSRADAARQVRVAAAQRQYDRPSVQHPVNGDESQYPQRLGNFSKALPHNNLGEVDLNAYDALLTAVGSEDPADYDSIPLGGTTKLANPLAANSWILEGPDSHSMSMPAPPSLASYTESGEMLEVYWQAVLRDVPFAEYTANNAVTQAVRELGRYPQFRTVTSNTLFRGETEGDGVGPYISQFLQKPIPFGAGTIEQRYRVPVAGDDHMTDFTGWLDIQNGAAPAASNTMDPTPRFLRNGRDIGEFVHQDTPSQAYYSAALIMSGWGTAALSDSNPYLNSLNQDAFVQFGTPHIIDMVTKAAVAALKCAWFQKWNVHRRLRPESFAGLVQNQITGASSYPIKVYFDGSAALETIFNQTGTYLLPMAYPEGSPTHPSYPAGHAAVAGACATMLKAFFNEDFEVPVPVQASTDGLSLVPYNGAPLTIGNEINKLAANISLARDFAGVHWRSDGIEGMNLGERVAIQILRDYANTYSEIFSGFSFRRFNGTEVSI